MSFRGRSIMIKRLGFSMECAGLLYLVCMGIGLIRLWRMSSISLVSIVGILSAPAVASLVFVGVGAVLPNLLGPGKLTVPLNVTLPAVYTTLLFAVLQLSAGTDMPFLKLREVYAWSAVWASPAMLLTGIGLQVVLLTILARLGNPQAETSVHDSSA